MRQFLNLYLALNTSAILGLHSVCRVDIYQVPFQLQDGLIEIISKLEDIKEENRDELIDILDSYFDPEKEAIVPASRPNMRRRAYKKGSPRRSRHSGDKLDKKHSQEANNNEIASPDSTTARLPRRQRRSRRRFSSKSLNKSLTDTDMGSKMPMPIAKPSAPEIAVA